MKYNKLKSTLGLLSVILSSSIAVNAQQRICNMNITLTAPADGAIIPALTTFATTITLENLGPDNLITGDTIYYNLPTMPLISYAQYILTQDINSGASASITLANTVNSNELTQDETMNYYVYVKSNLTNNGSFIDTADTDNNFDMNSVTFKAQNPVSVAAVSNQSIGLTVFPNPNSGLVNVSLQEGIQLKSISVADITGKILSYTVAKQSDNQQQINLMSLPSGIYFLKVNSSNGTAVAKVIKH